MKSKPDIHRLIELQKLLLVFRDIDRVVHIRKMTMQEHENDVEHSYSLAMVAWFLSSYFPALNKDKILKLALVHDLVEIYAGDTYAFAPKEVLANKKKREHEAYLKLKGEWPDFTDMLGHIDEYETLVTSESKFVYALDKIMPIMLIFINEGYTWQTEELTLEMLHANKQGKIDVSPEIETYYKQLYHLLKKNEHLFPNSSKQV